MKPILEIEQLSKVYRIRKNREPYFSLRESIGNFFKSKDEKTEEFYALKEISFKVEAGESIGIIGKNGAGKSTLLKVLSKITPPTSGRIVSRGRIASLLEVGTGFHPELTGRENIFLNGSILGMKRFEIQKKFDEIIDFSGVERFLDTPLKHYSSGMQLRLAFAVAAFLEPEILVIDEVLAVGDAEFQKKCLGKMEDVTKSGRTILFVSHSMSAVKQLCSTSVLIDRGNLITIGETADTLSQYANLQDGDNTFFGELILNNKMITKIKLFCDDRITNIIYAGCNLKLEVQFQSNKLINFPVLGIIIKDELNQSLIGINNKHYCSNLIQQSISKGTFIVEIPFFPLNAGNYSVDLFLGDGHTDMEILYSILYFVVEEKGNKNGIEIPNKKINKVVVQDVKWNLSNENN